MFSPPGEKIERQSQSDGYSNKVQDAASPTGIHTLDLSKNKYGRAIGWWQWFCYIHLPGLPQPNVRWLTPSLTGEHSLLSLKRPLPVCLSPVSSFGKDTIQLGQGRAHPGTSFQFRLLFKDHFQSITLPQVIIAFQKNKLMNRMLLYWSGWPWTLQLKCSFSLSPPDCWATILGFKIKS